MVSSEVGMKWILIDFWDLIHDAEVKLWLRNTFGPPSKTTWWVERDDDLTDLGMNEQIYMMYLLRWA